VGEKHGLHVFGVGGERRELRRNVRIGRRRMLWETRTRRAGRTHIVLCCADCVDQAIV
jgi:hypothetical protein